MARRYLQTEITQVLQSAIGKLQAAMQAIEKGEAAVAASVNAHQSPAEVNGVGQEAYQAAGILAKEATEMIISLGPDASTGFAFPIIAAIGSPRDFDLVDAYQLGGAPDYAIFIAKNLRQSTFHPNPFSELVVGDTVIVTKADVSGGVGDYVLGHVGDVADIDTDGGGDYFLRLDNTFKDATDNTHEEGSRLEIRVIDR